MRLFLRGMRARLLCLEGSVIGMSAMSALDLDDWIRTSHLHNGRMYDNHIIQIVETLAYASFITLT